MKEFLDSFELAIEDTCRHGDFDEDSYHECFKHFKYLLGLKLWERGGKQFVLWCRTVYWNPKDKKKHYPTISFMVEEAKSPIISKNKIGRMSQDFLDCLACLGEKKVKELIKELEVSE